MLIFLFALPLASGATLRLLDNRWEQSLSADFDLVARQVNQLIAPSDLFTEELPAENPTTDPKVSSRKTDFTKDIREQYALLQRDWTTKIQARWSAADIPSDADSDPEATIARIKTLKAEIHQDVQESIQNWKEFQLKVWIKGIARRWRGFEYQIHARLEKVVRAFGGALQHCLPGQYKQVAKRDLSTVLTLSVTLSIVVIAAFAVMQSEIILEAIGKFMDDLARKLMHKHGFADPDSVGSNATVVSSQPIPPVAPYNERDGWDPEFLKEEDLF